jgi:hypothetical protein
MDLLAKNPTLAISEVRAGAIRGLAAYNVRQTPQVALSTFARGRLPLLAGG